MTRCKECGVYVSSPFTCSYCGEMFCVNHAHVEKHNCSRSKMDFYSKSNDDFFVSRGINKKQTTRSSYKILILFTLLVSLVVPLYIIYNERELVIIDICINKYTILSGEDIILCINATSVNNNKLFKEITSSFGFLLGIDEYIPVFLDGNVIENTRINAKFNNYTINNILLNEKKPGIHTIKVKDTTLDFLVLNQSKVIIEEIESTIDNPRTFEPFKIMVTVNNLGQVKASPIIYCYSNTKIVETRSITLDKLSKQIISYELVSENVGINTYFIDGVSNNQTFSINICKPDANPFSDINYYYKVAEIYVKEHYMVPDTKDIEGLSTFLHQIRLPAYSEDFFDCSECTCIVEWLVEGAGFEAYIVKNSDWGETVVGPHAWVQVETLNGLVAVEATALTMGKELLRPGIVARPDGTFTQYTELYLRYKQWMIDYPLSIYSYNPNLTFEQWCDEYLINVPQTPGIPSQTGYYSIDNRLDSPDFLTKGVTISNVHYYQNITELDWWNHPSYNEIIPLNYWN